MSKTSCTISHRDTPALQQLAVLQHDPLAFACVCVFACVEDELHDGGDSEKGKATWHFEFQFQMLFHCPAARLCCSRFKLQWQGKDKKSSFAPRSLPCDLPISSSRRSLQLVFTRSCKILSHRWMWFITLQLKLDWSTDWPMNINVLASYSKGIKNRQRLCSNIEFHIAGRNVEEKNKHFRRQLNVVTHSNSMSSYTVPATILS